MPTIPKIYIALRQIPPNIEVETRKRLSDPMHYKLGRELEFDFLKTEDFLQSPPEEIFSRSHKPAFIIIDIEDANPTKVLEFCERESELKRIFEQEQYKLLADEYMPEDGILSIPSEGSYEEYKPRIILFKDVVSTDVRPEGLKLLNINARMVPPIDKVFEGYRDLIERKLVTRAHHFKAAVNIAVTNIINSKETVVLV